MAQFSMKITRQPGSLLGGNQHTAFRDEPALSFFLRWAAMSGFAEARSFATALGIHPSAIASGTAAADLARVAGLPPDAFSAGTPVRRDRTTAALGKASFNARHLVPWTRFCLQCARSDLQETRRPGEPKARLRTGWTLAFINACPIHGCLLIEFRKPGPGPRMLPLDILRDADPAGPIPETLVPAIAASTAAEAYMMGRLGLAPQNPSPLLDSCDFAEVPKLLAVLGKLALRNVHLHFDTPRQGNALYSAGYDVIKDDATFDAFLTQLVAAHRAESKRFSPSAGYSRLVSGLVRRPYGEAFLSIRRAIAGHASRQTAVGEMTDLYGCPVERNLFTMSHVEDLTGCWAGWAAKVMKAAGLTETDDPAQLVDRPTLAAFIALMEDSLKVRAAADFLGLTMESMRNLVRAGGIRPWAGGQGSEIHLWMFRRSELREFLESVTRFNGPRKRRPPAGTVTISQAVRRPGVTTVDLLARLRSGQIECAGLLAGKRLIPAILIRKADLDSTWSVTDDDWVTTTEVVRMLGITHANISALATFGVLDVSRPLRKARLYRKDAVEAFRRGYVSSTEAATILRTHARIVHHELRWEGIRASLPLPPERLEAYLHRKSALKWFLRAEVEALALRGGITRRIKRVPRTGNPVAVGKASSDPGSNSATLSG